MSTKVLLVGATLLALSACGAEGQNRVPVPPDSNFGTELGQTLQNISLPDCGGQMHDLHGFYKQGKGLLVVMTMGVG